MKQISIYLMLSLFLTGANAQVQLKDYGSKFGFQTGITYCQVQEFNLNGLVHSGPGINLAALYQHQSPNSVHKLELTAGLNFLKTNFETEPESYLIHISALYGISVKLAESYPKLSIHLGGQIQMQAWQGIYTNWDLNHFYWLTGYGLGIHGRAFYRFPEKSSLSFEFGLPLLSVVSRTPTVNMKHEDSPELKYITSRIHMDPALLLPFNHFSPTSKLAFHRDRGNGTVHTIFWKIDYVYNNSAGAERIRILNQVFGAEILF